MFNGLILFSKLLLIFFSKGISQLPSLLKVAIHRRTYKPGDSPRNIVVIGASFTGQEAARQLANSLPSGYRVVLIEKNDHFHFTWAFPRFSVISGHERKAFVPYDSYLKNLPEGSCLMLRDEVVEITKTEAVLKSGEAIEYEYLILATGSQAELPSRVNGLTKRACIAMLQGLQEKISAANHIVVLGGGAAGVELATDAKYKYPVKTVTLIHSRDHLLNTFGHGLHDRAIQTMKDLGVNVILNERVSAGQQKEGMIMLRSGQEVECDLLVKCIGQTPNSSILSTLSSDSINTHGHIAVKPTLQIKDHKFPNIFAAGDICDAKEQRNSRSAIEQASVVAKNVVNLIQDERLIEYRAQWWETGIDLTLGLHKHIMYLNDGHRELLWERKSTVMDLSSARVWKYLGATPFIDPSENVEKAV